MPKIDQIGSRMGDDAMERRCRCDAPRRLGDQAGGGSVKEPGLATEDKEAAGFAGGDPVPELLAQRQDSGDDYIATACAQGGAGGSFYLGQSSWPQVSNLWLVLK